MRAARKQVHIFGKEWWSSTPGRTAEEIEAAQNLWSLQNAEDTYLSVSPEDSRDIYRWENDFRQLKEHKTGPTKERLKELKKLHPAIFAEIADKRNEDRRKAKEEKEKKKENKRLEQEAFDAEFHNLMEGIQDVKDAPNSVLGIKYGSTKEEAKAAYRALAKIHHPDHGGDPEMMAEINTAYTKFVVG